MTIVLTQLATPIIISIFVTHSMFMRAPAHPSLPLIRLDLRAAGAWEPTTAVTAELTVRQTLSGRRHVPVDAM